MNIDISEMAGRCHDAVSASLFKLRLAVVYFA